MKSVSGINGGVAPSPPTAVEPQRAAPTAPAASGPATPAPQANLSKPEDLSKPEILSTPEYSLQELEAAVAELDDYLHRLPGRQREAHLRFEEEDRTYTVEIRDKETGELIQAYPPENLLNQDRLPADLVGTVIDRRS